MAVGDSRLGSASPPWVSGHGLRDAVCASKTSATSLSSAWMGRIRANSLCSQSDAVNTACHVVAAASHHSARVNCRSPKRGKEGEPELALGGCAIRNPGVKFFLCIQRHWENEKRH
jgi:hypothetical protein